MKIKAIVQLKMEWIWHSVFSTLQLKKSNLQEQIILLLLIRDKKVIKYKGDRFPIGAFEGDKPQQFKNNEIDLIEGDCLYLSSDGYADQFGGPENKKFMSKDLKNFFWK